MIRIQPWEDLGEARVQARCEGRAWDSPELPGYIQEKSHEKKKWRFSCEQSTGPQREGPLHVGGPALVYTPTRSLVPSPELGCIFGT